MITVNEMERKLRVLKEYYKEKRELKTLGVELNQEQIMEAFCDALSLAANDKKDWVYWYVYENDFGKRKLTVKVNGKEIVVDRVGRLMKVIEMTREVKG